MCYEIESFAESGTKPYKHKASKKLARVLN